MMSESENYNVQQDNYDTQSLERFCSRNEVTYRINSQVTSPHQNVSLDKVLLDFDQNIVNNALFNKASLESGEEELIQILLH